MDNKELEQFRASEKVVEKKPTKEEQEKLKEVKRQRKIAKDKLFPFLLTSSNNVEDAKNFLQIFSVAVRQAFNNKQLISTIGSLKIDQLMDKKSPDYKRYKFVLDLMKDETISVALGLTEGMGGAIDAFIRQEMMKRKLDSIKTEFLD